MWMGAGRPCLSVRNDIVTPRHLFSLSVRPRKSTNKLKKKLIYAQLHDMANVHTSIISLQKNKCAGSVRKKVRVERGKLPGFM